MIVRIMTSVIVMKKKHTTHNNVPRLLLPGPENSLYKRLRPLEMVVWPFSQESNFFLAEQDTPRPPYIQTAPQTPSR